MFLLLLVPASPMALTVPGLAREEEGKRQPFLSPACSRKRDGFCQVLTTRLFLSEIRQCQIRPETPKVFHYFEINLCFPRVAEHGMPSITLEMSDLHSFFIVIKTTGHLGPECALSFTGFKADLCHALKTFQRFSVLTEGGTFCKAALSTFLSCLLTSKYPSALITQRRSSCSQSILGSSTRAPLLSPCSTHVDLCISSARCPPCLLPRSGAQGTTSN